MICDSGCDGAAREPSQQPQQILRVRSELAQQPQPRVKPALAHDGQGRAEVGRAAVRVRPGGEQGASALPVLVDQSNEQWSLSLLV